MAGSSGLKRSKSVAPRPEEQHQFPYSSAASSLTAESPRKKSFWSFLYLPSSHQAAAAAAPYGNGVAAARRKSVSVASAAMTTLGRTLEAIGEPAESPSQVSSSSSSFGRKVARSRSVGCGSRSFSGDFLDRLSFGDCTLRRVESHREPKPNHKTRGGAHLGGGNAADEERRRRGRGGRVRAPPARHDEVRGVLRRRRGPRDGVILLALRGGGRGRREEVRRRPEPSQLGVGAGQPHEGAPADDELRHLHQDHHGRAAQQPRGQRHHRHHLDVVAVDIFPDAAVFRGCRRRGGGGGGDELKEI
ncbi:hypothetical protein PR202_ga01559 [Eleusine coracana subsp. coracana]|uniref:Uncharacterized protein n=1 Tax=Eleusine coracana subsp. coracana TaxID=191504 RepID=A0AAV5BHK4_ELECO|nr:hypothetical protein PR202_ga00872 [Eleusine coracana subsp. coracana]GJM85763.1 hypothetical protein PR202_ga01559 [Eleusine coracana subsp. coracana]